MKNKVVLVNEIDYVFEAWQLLKILACEAEQNYDEFKKSILEKYGSDSEHIRACISFGERGLVKTKEAFAGRENEIKTYFAPIENDIIPADLILCWSYWAGDNTVSIKNAEDMKVYYESLSEEVRDASFLKELAHDMEIEEFDRMVGCPERGAVVEKAERIHNIFSYIQKLELKAESKMRIQEIYLNRDAYIEPICKLYHETIELFYTLQEEMEELCTNWSDYWNRLVETDSFLEPLKGIVELDENALEKGFCIKPSVVQCAIMYINTYGELIPSRRNYGTTCMLGVMMTGEFNWNSEVQEAYRWDSMQPIFKALGDKSKADILLFIKDKPAYGSEIAKQFSLTTATVSHHMNKLLQLRLIQAEMQDGRVYYQARKEAIVEMFEQCKKIFE